MVQKEKEALAAIMLEHGIEWEQKDEHREHLSVLEYKQEQRTQELAELTQQTEQKAKEFSALEKKVEKVQKQNMVIEAVEKIEVKPMVLSSKVTLERSEYESLSTAAKKIRCPGEKGKQPPKGIGRRQQDDYQDEKYLRRSDEKTVCGNQGAVRIRVRPWQAPYSGFGERKRPSPQ